VFRLRQVALVAADLEPVVDELCRILEVERCYQDPGVGVFGLHNWLMPIGDTFLEVVSPKQEGTTAGRYLDRRGGDGGYMTIFQTDDLTGARQRFEDQGVRVVWRHDSHDMCGTHLHPKDVPGAIISVDWAEPDDHWQWAGPDWRDHVRTGLVAEIVGAEVQTPSPEATAKRWGEVLGRPVTKSAMVLDDPFGGSIRFVPIGNGRPEGLSGVDVRVADRTRAGELHEICGTRFYFV
jgi:Glyoxalase-like domain